MFSCKFFQVKFGEDIYIVQVDGLTCLTAKERARGIITEQLHNPGDFEIKECTLSNLLNAFHFVDDIAQLTPVRHP